MGRARSAVIIARLLDSEGFTDHTAQAVMRYGTSLATPQTKKRYKRVRKNAKEVLNRLTPAERMLVGRFISHQLRAGFDCGLRVGLTAYAVANDKDAETPFSGSQSEQDRTYWVEQLPACGGEWSRMENSDTQERATAKEFARAIAMREKCRARVCQMGHVVQRYNERGQKIGGDG